MHEFWLVLTYDLLEDRRTNDVIASNFFPLFFFSKMEESLKFLPDWVNEEIEKSFAEAVDKFQKQEEENNHVSL